MIVSFIETINLDPTDTTYVNINTCDASQVGTFTNTLANQYGCDSVIIETIALPGIPDTTYLNSGTCDAALAGMFTSTGGNQYGCDSVVIETITLNPTDTTYLNNFTCIASEGGTFYHHDSKSIWL